MLIGVCVLLTAASAIHAGQGYVGASYLNTEVDVDISGGWKIFGGYNTIKYFGVEGSYRDMGTFDNQGATTRSDADAIEFSVRGILPIGKSFELFGKIGYSRINEDLSGMVTGSFRRNQAIYGAGVDLKLKRIGIRAEWEKFETGGDPDSFGLGLYYRF